MALRIHSPSLATRTARLKLAMRKKPYTVQIAPGIWLTYRRNKGAGVWSVKAAFGLKKFALADDLEPANGETVMDYAQALEQARTLARAGEGHSAPLILVSEAIDRYETDLKARSARKTNATQVRFNMPARLAAKPVALLSESELQDWRNDLIVESGLESSSADRIGRSLKAALNLAARRDKRISNSAAWRHGLTKLPDAGKARNVILSDETVSAVVRTAYQIDHGMGLWIETLATTGARESQVRRLEVLDLQDDRELPRLLMPSSKKGKGRKIERKSLPITPQLAKVLRQAAAGRTPHMPLLEPIKQLSERFRAVTKQLTLGNKVTPYALRHSSIVRMLLKGVVTRLVASAHDTSVIEIERTYARYIVSDQTDAILRGTLLDFAEPTVADNVVPIARVAG